MKTWLLNHALRRLAPWWLLQRVPWGWACWADLATWKVGLSEWPEDGWRNARRTCQRDVQETGCCYCGRYQEAP